MTIKNKLLENIKIICYAAIIAGIIRSLLFEPFYIPSGSMKSDLLDGDFVIVSKSSYGYSKYSFPFAMIPFRGKVFFTEPKRGDVAVFRYPLNPKINYIKRLIGLPGDTVQIIGGRLYLNGELVNREYVGDFIDNNNLVLAQYRETLPSGKAYNITEQNDNSIKDNTPIYKVPQGHYFFLGDNRDNSQDSRFINQVGFVPKDHLIGRAKFIVMSWDRGIRFSRIFNIIK
jgi:signal peptidase I